MKFWSLLLLAFCLSSAPLLAQEDKLWKDSTRLQYFYQVFNQIDLADFQMGSSETVRDRDGNGLALALPFKTGKKVLLEFELGNSRTLYRGTVEDGVNVEFLPQSGSGYEAISSSTNVTYDFDVTFQNPYAGFNLLIGPFHIGGGRLFQQATGDIIISTQNVEIVKAHYETGTQMYWHAGLHVLLEDLFFAFSMRSFQSPELVIDDCNEAALGTVLCQRIEGVAGNRNLRSNQWGEGLVQLGLYF